ncbi:transcription factor Adf-1 [Nothobranchius furzeri]|uniref:Transcription factor Adf-1-like n=1 Tax=Nothobranchius furzeri TaxID=105023 RepID=A0A1A8V8E9_NOTFU|nr:transcription factor Adf-1 [Nothobranchius furzeri]KAF7199178.1 transcription factor Adf-1-like [Nothobranchius furzeri]
MDHKLIQAVCNYPELYNVTLPNYRCTESRANAWRDISMALGVPCDACKKRWKNLRDRYLKEVRLEIKTKKQGGFVQSKWKYRQLMNFIAPFTGSRVGVTDMCGNTEEERKNPDNVLGNEETTLSESVKTPQNITKVALSLPEAKPQVAFVTQLPALSQDIQLAVVAKTPPGPQVIPVSNNGQKRKIMSEPPSPSSPQSTHSQSKWLLKDHTTSFSSRPRDEDELFLLSFVPALKRLAPQTRCETKMKIQQIMYEAEFSTSPDESQEKRTAAGTQDKS